MSICLSVVCQSLDRYAWNQRLWVLDLIIASSSCFNVHQRFNKYLSHTCSNCVTVSLWLCVYVKPTKTIRQRLDIKTQEEQHRVCSCSTRSGPGSAVCLHLKVTEDKGSARGVRKTDAEVEPQTEPVSWSHKIDAIFKSSMKDRVTGAIAGERLSPLPCLC